MRSYLISALLGILVAPALANEANYSLFAVPGVFLVGGQGNDSLIDPDFRAGVPPPAAGQAFALKFKSSFPEVVERITDANKRRTFGVSLQIARASKYTIPKPDGTTDVFLPVTGSIYFTNLLTGEVLYTLTRTDIAVATLLKADTTKGSTKVKALFKDTFDGVLSELVKEARSKFQPTALPAVVRGDWKGLALLDAGSKDGIKKDDLLQDSSGNELIVLSAGPSYAIAQPQLGEFKQGVTFNKVTNQTLAEISRPRVLPLVERLPDGVPSEAVLQIFSDALGAKAPISLIPVNPTFTQVLQTTSASSSISQQVVYKRELPGLFLRLRVADPIEFEMPTSLAYKTRRVFESLVFGELVDGAGRIHFSGIGRNRVEDEVTAGISFNSAARREVVIKNALVDLANKFASDMKFADAQLTITDNGKTFTLKDKQAMLARGANWRVYRSIGKISGIKDEVRVPTWEFTVTDIDGETATATAEFPLVEGAPDPANGDVVFINGVMGKTPITRKRFALCPTEKLGSIDYPEYGAIAGAIAASHFKVQLFTQGLASRVAGLASSGAGFKSTASLKEPVHDYCIEPVHRIEPAGTECDAQVCRDTATVRLTYRIKQGGAKGEIKVRHGLETRLKATGALKSASEAARKTMLQSDLLDEILKLNTQLTEPLNKESY
jgi:hypothetical protein